jgi:outer membrane protein TolC
MRSLLSSRRWRRFSVACGAAAVLLLLRGGAAVAEDAASATDTIGQLLQQRLAIAEQMQETAKAAFQAGRASYSAVLQADLAVLEARLELAETRQERIKIYEQMMAKAKASQEIVLKLREAGRGSRLDLLKARDRVLELRIALERAKKNAKPSTGDRPK